MNMFQSFLKSIPKNRSEYVNDLEIPEITLEPYVWTELDESVSVKSDSIVPDSMDDDRATLSTDTTLPLSRAMTDSEIDYEYSRRVRHRRFSDPWDQLKATMDAFPSDYVSSLRRFQNYKMDSTDDIVATCAKERIRRRNDELLKKMKKFFREDCRAFSPNDPGLLALEEAVNNLDVKALDADLDDILA
ncbi:unnamed protein product [Arctia plantaginis]|uniref:Uncharacterized protein n=1 Tax=Arctia plantaginis TaxID=874455 RepID=A0A8S1BN99_ARCPL|nr:unnamed protein product [Arctia plantaginis]